MSKAVSPPTGSASTSDPAAAGPAGWIVAILLTLAVLAIVVGYGARSEPRDRGAFDVKTFGTLPLFNGGRAKPFDSVARDSLLIVSGRSSVQLADGKINASQWLLDVLARPETAADFNIFRIDNDGVKQSLGLTKTDRKRYSYREIIASEAKLDELVRQADAIDEDDREVAERQALELRKHLNVYESLMAFSRLHLVPPPDESPDKATPWKTLYETVDLTEIESPLPPTLEVLRQMGQKTTQAELTAYEAQLARAGRALGTVARQEMIAAYVKARQTTSPSFDTESLAVVEGYQRLFDAYAKQDASKFGYELKQLQETFATRTTGEARRANVETSINRTDPFFQCQVLYVFVMVFVFISWLLWRKPLTRTANMIMIAALIIHTVTLLARVWISGRPPVTNLYSSAVFIGWGCVAFGICLEQIHRNGFGTLVGAVVGFLSLQVSRGLSGDGDTMGVLQAVLSTNFWLTTHVLTITLGYMAMFIAGFFGILYICIGLLTPLLDRNLNKVLGQMIYGTVCFAVLLSFIGTVLGGIWADQSWGRFWGWDPKENGAVLIVLWSALILHARWGGIIQQRGLAVLAVFGNVVTAWSWFGTNMLGAGLHAYGFIAGSLGWMFIFVFSQLLIMNMGMRPTTAWVSRVVHPAGRRKAKAAVESTGDVVVHSVLYGVLLLIAVLALQFAGSLTMGSFIFPVIVVTILLMRRWAMHWIARRAAEGVVFPPVIRMLFQTGITIFLLTGMITCVYLTDLRSLFAQVLAIVSVSFVVLLGVAGEIAAWVAMIANEPRIPLAKLAADAVESSD